MDMSFQVVPKTKRILRRLLRLCAKYTTPIYSYRLLILSINTTIKINKIKNKIKKINIPVSCAKATTASYHHTNAPTGGVVYLRAVRIANEVLG